MNMPGFTADTSLYQTSRHYRTSSHANNHLLPKHMFGTIHLEATNEGINEEVINVTSHFDPDPDWSQILGGFGPRPGGVGWGPGESPGGGPGPHGGGGGAASVPSDIVTECLGVGGKFGEKYCGGIGGPSCCKTCAQTVCQQKKCTETKRCDPNQLNAAKEGNCDLCCDGISGCKDGLIVKKEVVTGAPASRPLN
jgi:hypothetical protein